MKHKLTEEQIAEFHVCPYCGWILESRDSGDMDSPKQCYGAICPERVFWEEREDAFLEQKKNS